MSILSSRIIDCPIEDRWKYPIKLYPMVALNFDHDNKDHNLLIQHCEYNYVSYFFVKHSKDTCTYLCINSTDTDEISYLIQKNPNIILTKIECLDFILIDNIRDFYDSIQNTDEVYYVSVLLSKEDYKSTIIDLFDYYTIDHPYNTSWYNISIPTYESYKKLRLLLYGNDIPYLKYIRRK